MFSVFSVQSPFYCQRSFFYIWETKKDGVYKRFLMNTFPCIRIRMHSWGRLTNVNMSIYAQYRQTKIINKQLEEEKERK